MNSTDRELSYLIVMWCSRECFKEWRTNPELLLKMRGEFFILTNDDNVTLYLSAEIDGVLKGDQLRWSIRNMREREFDAQKDKVKSETKFFLAGFCKRLREGI